jgi:hypothetical protein
MRRVGYLLIAGLVIGAAAMGLTAAFDHPAAGLGVGGTTLTAFETVDNTTRNYTVEVTVETAGGSTLTYYRSERNGTRIERYRPGVDAAPYTLVETVTVDGETFGRQTYPTAADVPSIDRANATVEGDTIYFEGGVSAGDGVVAVIATVTDRVVLAADGPVTRDGERYRRYDVVGTTAGVVPAHRANATGYVLVDPATDTVRTLDVTADYEGEQVTIHGVARPQTDPLPSWVRARHGD